MELLVQILAIISPLFIFLTAWTVMRTFLRREGDVLRGFLLREAEARRFELQHKNRETTLPIRLQAYERMTLFCSRIELSQIIMRILPSCVTAKDLRIMLALSLDEEFNHNITQQMYMSTELWDIISLAKLEANSIIKKVSDTVPDDAKAQAWIDAFLQYVANAPQQGHVQAQLGIKKEVSLLF